MYVSTHFFHHKVILVQNDVSSFDVKLERKLSNLEALDEISNRISIFCSEFYSKTHWSCERKGKNHICIIERCNKAGKGVSQSIHNIQEQNTSSSNTIVSLLMDLHFYTPIDDDKNEEEITLQSTDSVTVQFACYCHSKEAKGKFNTLQKQVRHI